MRNRLILAAVAAALSIAAGAHAQAPAGAHAQAPAGGHVHGPQAPAEHHAGHHAEQGAGAPADNAAVRAYRQVNDKMHADMAVEFTGNADVDFLRGMIPHHQGAIDMARVVLEHGSDPEVRKLAQQIIAAQQEEIALMRQWLAERDHSAMQPPALP